jgi:hypothetical protein
MATVRPDDQTGLPLELVFRGVVTRGCGRYGAELQIPGHALVPDAPRDWPTELHPGSFNVRVSAPCPQPLTCVTDLDKRGFPPEFELRVKEKRPQPIPDLAQAWRATLLHDGRQTAVPCWALRRYKSDLSDVLELVQGFCIRDRGFDDGDAVTVTLYRGRVASPRGSATSEAGESTC